LVKERPLGKCCEDERLRRLINNLQDLEGLRSVALQLLELKIGQEAGFYRLLFGWQGITQEQVEALLGQPPAPPLDPFDTNI
jgi:hypothetical protein